MFNSCTKPFKLMIFNINPILKIYFLCDADNSALLLIMSENSNATTRKNRRWSRKSHQGYVILITDKCVTAFANEATADKSFFVQIKAVKSSLRKMCKCRS